MNNKLKKFIPILIILFIICLASFIYLNKDLIFKDKEIKENVDIEDKDEPILEIEDQEVLDKQEEVIVPEEEVKEDNNIVPDNNEEQSNKVESNKNNTTKPNKSNNNTNNSTNNNNNSSNDTTNNNNNNSSNDSNTNDDNNNSSNDNNTNDDNNNSSNDNSESNDEPVEEDNTPAVTPTPTQKELNEEYRKKLQNAYSVKIAYGEEMGNYIVAYYTPTKMNDDNTINEYLGRIETELKKYPDGFFKEMNDYGMPLTIYLVKDIPNSSISGFTDSQIYSNIIITIKESTLFETTLNHELMHYIDAYLNSKLYPNSVDTTWNLLNPEGYTYGSFDTNYDYFPTQNNNAYFFTNYAQTNYKEDRATLFGDLMTRVIKRNCYNEGYPLYSKIKLLAEQIDEGFVTVTSSNIEYWEKFI